MGLLGCERKGEAGRVEDVNGSLSASRSCRKQGNTFPSTSTDVFHKHVCGGCQNQYIIQSGGLKAVQWPKQLWYCGGWL